MKKWFICGHCNKSFTTEMLIREKHLIDVVACPYCFFWYVIPITKDGCREADWIDKIKYGIKER